MRLTAPIVALVCVMALAAGLVLAHASAPTPITARTVATASSTTGPTVTVTGTGFVQGTPDQATMSFGVEVTAPTAAGAYAGEAAQARRLIDALHGAGVADGDIHTEWVSLYPNQPAGGFSASSSVSAVIHGIDHAGSVIDAAVRAAGDSIRLQGISLSISDTSALMAEARTAAIHDARTKAQQYAQGAGLKLGGIVSISEGDSTPRPVMYAGATPSAAQPIEAGRQTLQVSVGVVYELAQ